MDSSFRFAKVFHARVLIPVWYLGIWAWGLGSWVLQFGWSVVFGYGVWAVGNLKHSEAGNLGLAQSCRPYFGVSSGSS